MPSQLARFTNHCVDLSKKAVTGDPEPAIEKGDGGYADWVLVAIHRLREYLDQPYRRLLDMLHEMPRITAQLGLSVDELPDFTTVCTRKQDLEMRIWRVLLRSSASLHEFGEVQAIDATGFKRHDEAVYHRRSIVEAVFFALKHGSTRRYGREPGLDSSENSP